MSPNTGSADVDNCAGDHALVSHNCQEKRSKSCSGLLIWLVLSAISIWSALHVWVTLHLSYCIFNAESLSLFLVLQELNRLLYHLSAAELASCNSTDPVSNLSWNLNAHKLKNELTGDGRQLVPNKHVNAWHQVVVICDVQHMTCRLYTLCIIFQTFPQENWMKTPTWPTHCYSFFCKIYVDSGA